MKIILSVSDPNVYARFLGAPALHPLVNVIHYDEVEPDLRDEDVRRA